MIVRAATAVTITLSLLLAGCAQDELGSTQQAAGNVVKSQLRGYDLGPPFPAGLRDSGLINGYSEGEWVPFVAVVEGRKLEVADESAGSVGDGVYLIKLMVPTYSDRNSANGISDLVVTGTYGSGALTPIPSPFDKGWLVDNGYDPFVLGAYGGDGSVDLAPAIEDVDQRTGPTRFGGNVSSATITIRFSLNSDATSAELRFAVRLAPTGLQPIRPGDSAFPGTLAGSTPGAGSFFPGPGPIFVGYFVGKPTGIATVPIRVDRNSCTTEDDCLPGEVCRPGEGCTDPCTTDAECTPDEICEDGVCTPPPPSCTDNEDCNGDVCVGGFCVPECPTGCNDPEFCDADPCVPPDGDPPCVLDGQCPPNNVCEDGLCQPPKPPCDVSCPNGDACIGNECVPPDQPCTDSGECSPGDVCEDGVCNPGTDPCPDCLPCADKYDCPGGTTCAGGHCQPLQPPDPCTDASQCADGYSCEDGYCEPPPEPCGPTGECRPGELCEEGPNVCVPEHDPIPCATPTDCPDGDQCTGGYCTPPGGPGWPCQNKHDCQDGYTCQSGVCTPPDNDPCSTNADCSPGDYCIGGTCTPPHPPVPCATVSDCPNGDECHGGYCEPPGGCTVDRQCPGGELCEDGKCRPGEPPVPCELNSDCPPGEDDVWAPVCYGGFCRPGGPSCTTTQDCDGGQVCVDGNCMDADPPTPCQTQYDCGGGAACEGGFCRPTGDPNQCETGDDCPHTGSDDVGPACVNGVCTSSRIIGPACTGTADCTAGTKCVANVCVPFEGACDLSSDCADGESCIAGWCGSACTQAADCGPGQQCALGRCAAECDTYITCAAGEACYAGGCVPLHAITANGRGGSEEPWQVDVPSESNNSSGGGCSTSGGESPLGLALLVLVGLMVGLRRRPRGASWSVGLLTLAAVLAVGCGSGSGGAGSADASVADEADAFGTGSATADAGPGPDGLDPSSPFLMVTCEDSAQNDADAGVGNDAGIASGDAGVGDAGAPEGIDEPCCNPDGKCSGGLACIVGPSEDQHRCRPTCDLATRECPYGGVCANFGGQGVCIPASTEGADCAPELCDSATICVGNSADDAVCRRRCETADDCDQGQMCATLSGSDAKACLEGY